MTKRNQSLRPGQKLLTSFLERARLNTPKRHKTSAYYCRRVDPWEWNAYHAAGDGRKQDLEKCTPDNPLHLSCINDITDHAVQPNDEQTAKNAIDEPEETPLVIDNTDSSSFDSTSTNSAYCFRPSNQDDSVSIGSRSSAECIITRYDKVHQRGRDLPKFQSSCQPTTTKIGLNTPMPRKISMVIPKGQHTQCSPSTRTSPQRQTGASKDVATGTNRFTFDAIRTQPVKVLVSKHACQKKKKTPERRNNASPQFSPVHAFRNKQEFLHNGRPSSVSLESSSSGKSEARKRIPGNSEILATTPDSFIDIESSDEEESSHESEKGISSSLDEKLSLCTKEILESSRSGSPLREVSKCMTSSLENKTSCGVSEATAWSNSSVHPVSSAREQSIPLFSEATVQPSTVKPLKKDVQPASAPPVIPRTRQLKRPLLRSLARRQNTSAVEVGVRGGTLVSKGEKREEEGIEAPQCQTYEIIEDGASSVFGRTLQAPDLYTLKEFKLMWDATETDFGFTTEDIEEGPLVRAANSQIDRQDSGQQAKAQYGRLLPGATDKIFRDVLQLQRDDVFVDIGHGIGNSVIQAAYTIGCESRGIEVVESRNFLANQFWKNLEGQRKALHSVRDGRHFKIGPIRMRHGRLEEEIHRKFISDHRKMDGSGSVKALANNFNGVFADRCAKKNQMYYLDSFIAGLFARMKPGSVLVTLHPLLDLPPSRSSASETRERHKLKCDDDVSFYEMEQFNVGKCRDTVSWSANGSCTKDLIVYRYRRIKQKSIPAVFLCTNPSCPKARNGIPVAATKQIEFDAQNSREMRTVINHCDCKITGKLLRQKKHVDYNGSRISFEGIC